MDLSNQNDEAVRRALRDASELMRGYTFSVGNESDPSEMERVTSVHGRMRRQPHVAVYMGKRECILCSLYLGGKLRPLLYFSETSIPNIERAMRFMNLLLWHMWQYRARATTPEPYDADLPFSAARAKRDREKESPMMEAVGEIERSMNAAGLLKSRRLGAIPAGDSRAFKAAAISEIFNLRAKLGAVEEALRVSNQSTARQDAANVDLFESNKRALYAVEDHCERLEKQLAEAVTLIKTIAEKTKAS